MAGKDSEGLTPVDESSKYVEGSPKLNRNPKFSREMTKTAPQPMQFFKYNVRGKEQLH